VVQEKERRRGKRERGKARQYEGRERRKCRKKSAQSWDEMRMKGGNSGGGYMGRRQSKGAGSIQQRCGDG
jgi:hypothetical protein